MWNLTVITQWTTGEGGANVPAIVSLLGPGDSCQDITGQPVENITPDPNLVVWQVTCSDTTYDVILADTNTTVLTAEEIIDESSEA